MTINTVSINASHLARVAEAVSSLNQLPAVAAPGWCEAAAKIVASLQPGSIGVVRVARFDPSGEAVEHVASGGWNSTTNSSAPAEKLAEHFGFTPSAIAERVKAFLSAPAAR